jgi:hypothetical protein
LSRGKEAGQTKIFSPPGKYCFSVSSVHPEMWIFVQDQGMRKKITTEIYMVFRGLFFEHNADIGQKDRLWMDTG